MDQEPNKGVCMTCKETVREFETLLCKTCKISWHMPCLLLPPGTIYDWECLDCSEPIDINIVATSPSLNDEEKAEICEELVVSSTENNIGSNGVLDIFDHSINCSYCMELPERPVTTPCGHNFCLQCFVKWIKDGNGKRNCLNCKTVIPAKMTKNPKINFQLTNAIRVAKLARLESVGISISTEVSHIVHDDQHPDTCYKTERTKKSGKANVVGGKIFVTIPMDHFGPIIAENDPTRSRGVLVGDTWGDRMECKQWGAHFPHIAGIAGQSSHGAQSVALSGGYIDDEDHGEWFLYTGSGGKNIAGNKGTYKKQSFDQKFKDRNEALRLSCRKGYPVRVIRSHKEKHSSYAPKAGVRYDGVYRIEKCWRKIGKQGYKVCRYLFVRCDNEPAPWTSDLFGDRPRPLPIIQEFKDAFDITERNGDPSWDFDEEKDCWLWKKPPPLSKKPVNIVDPIDGVKIEDVSSEEKNMSFKINDRLLKEFVCNICHNVLASPLKTPCGHNFCKVCLEGVFSGQSYISKGEQKNIMKCPTCSTNIVDYLQNPQVNREIMDAIESLQREVEQMKSSEESIAKSDENLILDEGIEVSKPCDSSEIFQEKINENDMNAPQKRRKGNGGKTVVNMEEHIDEAELESKKVDCN